MKLHYHDIGAGQPPLLIIHGLFGSADNWRSMAKYFSKYYRVISIDLRNHGRSPHSDQQDFALMAEDLALLCDEIMVEKVSVLGHSLGGKVAMQFASDYADKVEKLIVVDISPRQYFSEHTPLMDAMMALDLTRYTCRHEVDEALSDTIQDATVRQFLLMNLQSDNASQLYWRINLPALKANYHNLMAPVCEHVRLAMPSLFVYGGLSEYVTEADKRLIDDTCLNARFQVIDKAGHWVHAERPQQFKQVVEDFLRHD